MMAYANYLQLTTTKQPRPCAHSPSPPAQDLSLSFSRHVLKARLSIKGEMVDLVCFSIAYSRSLGRLVFDIISACDPIFEVNGQTYAEMSFEYKVSSFI